MSSINVLYSPNNDLIAHTLSLRSQKIILNDNLDRDLYILPPTTPLPLIPSVVVPDVLTGKQLNWVPLSFFLDKYVIPQYLFINCPIDNLGNGLQTEATGGTLINFTRPPQDVIISDGIGIVSASPTGQYFTFTPDAFGIYEYNFTFEGYGNDTGAIAQLLIQYGLDASPFTILFENRSAWFEIPFSSTAKITKCNIELNGLYVVNRADTVTAFTLVNQGGTNIITYGASLTMKKVANLPPASVFVPPVEVVSVEVVPVEVVPVEVVPVEVSSVEVSSVEVVPVEVPSVEVVPVKLTAKEIYKKKFNLI